MDGAPCGINKVNLRCAKDWASKRQNAEQNRAKTPNG